MTVKRPSKLRTAIAWAVVTALGVAVLPPYRTVRAIPNTLPNRSILISDSKPSATPVTYLATFDILTPGPIGSINFLFCQETPIPDETCTTPAGFSASGVVLTSQSGTNDFSIHANSSAGEIILTRTPGAVGLITMSFTFDGITNPSTEEAFYARISTYATTDATGPRTDKGGIAMTTVSGFDVTTEVPPILTFCAGAVINSDDCSDVQGDAVDVGVLSSRSTATGTSQMVVGTNAGGGYTVSVSGTTMTAGNEIINAMANQGPSQRGTSQFGINLRQNSSPAIGGEPGGFGSGQPASTYNTPNLYRFRNGDALASKGGTEDYRKYTISYVANVPTTQLPGVYATTLSYICLANF